MKLPTMPALAPLCAAAAAVLAVLAPHAAPSQEGLPTLASLTVTGVRDLQASVAVEKADLRELEKINKDFGILYRLRDVTIQYKEPDKFRMDNRLGTFLVNGATRHIRVPQLGIRRKDDLGTELSRRHSLMDLGIITPGRLEHLRSRYLRTESLGDRALPVFEVSFPGDERTKYIVWLDPATRITVKRQWLDAEHKVRATFAYLEPREAAKGIWLPTRAEVRNAEGAIAGATVYKDLKLNQDLPDSVFEAL